MRLATLRVWTLSLIGIGIFLRFYHLDYKFYWFDEVFTALRASGHTESNLIQTIAQTKTISVADLLQTYQAPVTPTIWLDTVASLAIEEPQHPPLYFLLIRLWQQGLGDSIATTRSLSAVISLLAFPGLYWLCQELFQSAIVGWISLALLAISPFQILYAQEAREYSLWFVAIIFSHAAFLQATRTQRIKHWIIYSFSLSLGLYTFPSTLFVMTGHAFYCISAGFKPTSALRNYSLATLASLVSFLPWLIILCSSLGQINKTFVRIPPAHPFILMRNWGLNLCRVWIDLGDYQRDIQYFGWKPVYLLGIPVTLGLTLLSLYALWFLHRVAPKPAGRFIWISSGVIFVPIALLNLVRGGEQSTIPRYLMPAVLGIYLAVAFLIAQLLQPAYPRPSAIRLKQQNLAKAIAIALILGGLLSCSLSSQARFWWSKTRSDMNFLAAPLINQAAQPLVISDAPMGRILAFSHLLNGNVQLQLNPSCFTCRRDPPRLYAKDLTQIADHFHSVFLYNASPTLITQFEQQNLSWKPIFLDPVHPEQKILQLSRNP